LRTPDEELRWERLAVAVVSLASSICEIARKFGRQGGKKSAASLTPEQRSERARKASLAAAKKRTADRLARERQAKAKRK